MRLIGEIARPLSGKTGPLWGALSSSKIPEMIADRAILDLCNSPPRLIAHIKNRLAFGRAEVRRSNTILGKLFGKLSSDTPGEIILHGQVVKKLFELADEGAPLKIFLNAEYAFEIQEAEELLSRATNAMNK